MHRIAVTLVLCLALSPAALAKPRDIDFKVYRDGEEMGHHRVRFHEAGRQIAADTDIELAVTFAGFRVFLYTHRSREIWQDGALQSIVSSTHDDGDDLTLMGARQGGGLVIEGTKFTGEAPGHVAPTSYWFPAFVQHSAFLDTQNGRVFNGAIARVGEERIVAGGVEITATRYTLTEALVMNLWYDADGNWVKTSFEARGSQIDYVLQPPAAQSQ